MLAQLVREGSRLLGPVRHVAKLLEEPSDAHVRATTIPCNGRNTLNEFVDRREVFTEGVFDPKLDLQRDIALHRRLRMGKRGDKGAYFQGDVVPPPVKTRSFGHGCGTVKSVAGCGPTMCNGIITRE